MQHVKKHMSGGQSFRDAKMTWVQVAFHQILPDSF